MSDAQIVLIIVLGAAFLLVLLWLAVSFNSAVESWALHQRRRYDELRDWRLLAERLLDPKTAAERARLAEQLPRAPRADVLRTLALDVGNWLAGYSGGYTNDTIKLMERIRAALEEPRG